MGRMHIGELARLVGVSPRTVRHYHRVGVLPEPVRAPNGYREYGVSDAVLLVRARRLVAAGLALEDIAEVLADERSLRLDELLAEVVDDLDRREREIQGQRGRVAALRSRLGGPAPTSDALDPEGLVEFFDAVRGTGPGYEAMAKDRQLLSVLPGEAAAQVSDVLAAAAADEQATARLAVLYERFDALAHGPAPGPELIVELSTGILGALPAPLVEQAEAELASGTTTDLTWITGELSPGQQLVIDALVALLSGSGRVE